MNVIVRKRDFYDGIRLLNDSSKTKIIGIEWRFDDGTRSRYYPDDLEAEWFVFFIDSVKAEETLTRKERRHCLIPLVGGGKWYDSYFRKEDNPVSYVNLSEERIRAKSFIKSLSMIERRRLLIKLEYEKMSFSKIAAIEGTSKIAIFKTFVKIRKKALKAGLGKNMKIFNMM